jgi:uncharacterized protein YbjT (DUF2867 family)
MKITITGSLGNISKNLIKQLTNKGHELKVVSHDREKKKAIEDLGAVAAIGSIEDVDFLTKAFEGANAIYTMIPPKLDSSDYAGYMKSTAKNYSTAIERTSVKTVVNLSGIGAHLGDGHGPSGAFFHVENELNGLKQTNVLHLRPGMFFTNFFGNIGMIKQMNMLGNNFDGSVKIILTHPRDISEAVAQLLDNPSFEGKVVKYVVSDEKSGSEIAQILGKAVGKPNLPWITFPDEQLQKAMIQNGFSEHMASNFVEMGTAIREGKLFSDYEKNQTKIKGKISFEEFAEEFASVYNKQP